MRAKFVEMAPAAQERLEELAKNADSEKVRLEANIQILDRAGLKPPDKVELAGVGIFGDAPMDEIVKLIQKNLGEIN